MICHFHAKIEIHQVNYSKLAPGGLIYVVGMYLL